MKLGFVGLGNMGAPMACNLSKAADVVVYDRNIEKRKKHVAKGGRATDNLLDMAQCEVVFLCLPGDEAVEDLLFGSGGLAEALKSDTTIVDTSTVSYGLVLSLAERLQARNVSFIDAPISGMPARAQDGTLTMMCGGDGALIDKLHAPMSAMASKIVHMGATGSGQLAKLINQLLFDINAAALAEILPLGVKLGLDPEQIGAVVNSGTGRSYASDFFIPRMLKENFNDGYPMAAAYKDLVSGAQITAHNQIPAPVLAAATSTYQQALRLGHGDKDKGGMICVFEDLLGVKFRQKDQT